jgi:hypothetical protein
MFFSPFSPLHGHTRRGGCFDVGLTLLTDDSILAFTMLNFDAASPKKLATFAKK